MKKHEKYFFEELRTKCGGEASPRCFCEKYKWSIPLGQRMPKWRSTKIC